MAKVRDLSYLYIYLSHIEDSVDFIILHEYQGSFFIIKNLLVVYGSLLRQRLIHTRIKSEISSQSLQAFDYIVKDNTMNLNLFYCLIVSVKSRMMVNVTRYECDFTITRIAAVEPFQVNLELLMGRSNKYFSELVSGDQSGVTIRLHVEKKHAVFRRGTKSTPKCNGEKVKAAIIQSFDDYELIISSHTVKTYVSHNHPDDCKHDEIGYTNSNTCHGQGNLCLTVKTGVKKCRCQAGFMGTHCSQLVNNQV